MGASVLKNLRRPAIGVLCLCSACTTALPERNPELPVAKAVQASEQSADRAVQAAQRAQLERQQVEQLLVRANQLLVEARASEEVCRSSIARLEKKQRESARLRRLRRAPEKGSAVDEKKAEKKDEIKKDLGPLYSPSDAPVGYYRKGSADMEPAAQAEGPAQPAKNVSQGVEKEQSASHEEAPHAEAHGHE